MKSPWTKKNPFMSMYLSAANTVANSVAGSVRSRASAEMRRQATAAMAQGTREIARFWTNVLTPPPPQKRTRKTKKSG